jgi:hypothetical protein
MIFKLSDGTEVEYHVLTPADATVAVCLTSDDVSMFVEIIRLAVANYDDVLQHIAGLPEPLAQTALLGTEIVAATLRAEGKLQTAGE